MNLYFFRFQLLLDSENMFPVLFMGINWSIPEGSYHTRQPKQQSFLNNTAASL